MSDFLFSLLVTKSYRQNEKFFFISKKINIKVETQNTFIDFFSKFPILTLFSRTKLESKNMSPLHINKEKISNEQIVANYLKALKKNIIDNTDIIFPMITPELKTKELNKKLNYKIEEAQIISDKECNVLILEAIKTSNKIENPNHYQIKIFINILGAQLTKFSQNYFLSAYNILSLGDKNLFSMRSFIIKSFINITKYFTQTAFDDLLKSQIITHDILFGQYDEKEDIKNAINNLAKIKNNIFSYEKIDSSFLIFHEGNTD